MFFVMNRQTTVLHRAIRPVRVSFHSLGEAVSGVQRGRAAKLDWRSRTSWELVPMKRSLRWCIGAVLGLAVGAAGPAKAGLVVNGNFGTGDFTGWTLSGDTSGPDYVSGTFPGPYAAALTTSVSDVFLSQTLPLSTVVGQEYLFSFSLAGDGATPNTFSASLGNVPETTSLFSRNMLSSPPLGAKQGGGQHGRLCTGNRTEDEAAL